MTHEDFMALMNELYTTFGAKAYPTARTRLIWDLTKDLTQSQFSRVITHFTMQFRQAPLPKDFLEAAIRERNAKSSRSQSADPYSPDCQKCLGAGVFEVRAKSQADLIFVRCNCADGKKSIHNFLPVWDAFTWGKNFTPVYMGEGRHLDWKPRAGIAGLEEQARIWLNKIKQSQKFWSKNITGETNYGG